MEHSWIGYDADETRQNEHREGERLRPCRQADNPLGVLGMIRRRVLDVGIHEDVYIGKQHFGLRSPLPVPYLVLLRVNRAGRVKIEFGSWANPAHGDQPEWRLLQRLTTLQGIR